MELAYDTFSSTFHESTSICTLLSVCKLLAASSISAKMLEMGGAPSESTSGGLGGRSGLKDQGFSTVGKVMTCRGAEVCLDLHESDGCGDAVVFH